MEPRDHRAQSGSQRVKVESEGQKFQAWATTQKTTVDMVGQETLVAPVNLEDEGEPLEQDEEVRELLVESVEEEGLWT